MNVHIRFTASLLLGSLVVMPAFGDWSDVAASARPAVVFIRHRDGTGSQSTGTGFMASSDGLIVTCAHVVTPLEETHQKGKQTMKDRIWVRLYDNSTREATIHSCQRDSDIAVISIEGSGYPCLYVTAALPRLAEEVCVIGYPLGDALGKEVSVTKGIISALRAGDVLYQIDAAANPGSSGAPVLDKDGDVIGVVSFKLHGTEGLNFAISASQIPLTQLETHEGIEGKSSVDVGETGIEQADEEDKTAKPLPTPARGTKETTVPPLGREQAEVQQAYADGVSKHGNKLASCLTHIAEISSSLASGITPQGVLEVSEACSELARLAAEGQAFEPPDKFRHAHECYSKAMDEFLYVARNLPRAVATADANAMVECTNHTNGAATWINIATKEVSAIGKQ